MFKKFSQEINEMFKELMINQKEYVKDVILPQIKGVGDTIHLHYNDGEWGVVVVTPEILKTLHEL